MPLILNIDTATENASICLSDGEEILAVEENREQKNHGSFLQPAIKRILLKAEKVLADLDAIAITEGPGSYTGLRVGLASAKGLSYAINKPLLLINTLQAMVLAAIYKLQQSQSIQTGYLFCPMINARRMEVFTAVYDSNLVTIMEPIAMVLDENSFSEFLSTRQLVFSGSGHSKFKNITRNQNAIFLDVEQTASDLRFIANIMFQQGTFADTAYSQPFYLKEFFNPPKKDKI